MKVLKDWQNKTKALKAKRTLASYAAKRQFKSLSKEYFLKTSEQQKRFFVDVQKQFVIEATFIRQPSSG